MNLTYAITPSPLGAMLVAATGRGLRATSFGSSPRRLESELLRQHPTATLTRNDAVLSFYVTLILAHLDGAKPDLDIPLDIPSTPLENRVWTALRSIPSGATRGYGEIARQLDTPTTAQEVAQACASNPVALVIPCHRVIRADGSLSGYRWGPSRKRRLLEIEGAPGFTAESATWQQAAFA